MPVWMISIHALREEGDRRRAQTIFVTCYFYPRPPRGGRQYKFKWLPGGLGFLSTPSARRATAGFAVCGFLLGIFLSTPSARRATRRAQRAGRPEDISIHALREEGDFTGWATLPASTEFLSTPSARRATRDGRRKASARDISIHALREEGDFGCT